MGENRANIEGLEARLTKKTSRRTIASERQKLRYKTWVTGEGHNLRMWTKIGYLYIEDHEARLTKNKDY